MDSQLARLCDAYFRSWMAADPFTATEFGVTGYDAEVPDPSREADSARIAELERLGAEVARLDPATLTPDERVSRSMLLRLAADEREELGGRLDELAVTATSVGAQTRVLTLVPRAPLNEPRRARQAPGGRARGPPPDRQRGGPGGRAARRLPRLRPEGRPAAAPRAARGGGRRGLAGRGRRDRPHGGAAGDGPLPQRARRGAGAGRPRRRPRRSRQRRGWSGRLRRRRAPPHHHRPGPRGARPPAGRPVAALRDRRGDPGRRRRRAAARRGGPARGVPGLPDRALPGRGD